MSPPHTHRLPSPAGFDVSEAMRFLAPRAVAALERVDDDRYTRSLRIDGRILTLAVEWHDGRRLAVRTKPAIDGRAAREVVRALLDLGTDVDGFRSHVADDDLLGPLVAARADVRIPQYVDPFEGIVRAILGQQVSLAAARTMTDRLVRLAAITAPPLDGLDLLAFPSPTELLALGERRLQGIGLTGGKTRALRATAEAVLDGTLDWNWLREAAAGEAQTRLESVRGVGPWTAAYVRMRALGDRDAFPATDMGVIKAFQVVWPCERPTTARIIERAGRWSPWRAYATMVLWRSS